MSASHMLSSVHSRLISVMETRDRAEIEQSTSRGHQEEGGNVDWVHLAPSAGPAQPCGNYTEG